MFVGGFLLFAALITWGTAILLSPHGSTVADGTEHVRTTVVIFLRNAAIGTLVLCGLSAYLLFPARRPNWPRRDWAIIAVLGIMVATSIYQLIWLQTSVVG
jgi:hypothetical protein